MKYSIGDHTIDEDIMKRKIVITLEITDPETVDRYWGNGLDVKISMGRLIGLIEGCTVENVKKVKFVR